MPPELHRRAQGPGETITRRYQARLVARAAVDGVDERIIEGVAVPYGEVTTVRDSPSGPIYRETVDRGAAAGVDVNRILFDYLTEPPEPYNTHAGSRLAGRAVAMDDRPDGLHIALRASRTAAGDEALELARDGVLGDLSVNMRPISSTTRADGVVARTAIDVLRVTLVERGAYQGAMVTAVRADRTEGGMHCPHCGAALSYGVGHSCPGLQAARSAQATAAPAAAAAPAAGDAGQLDDQLDDQVDDAIAGSPRPHRTRVTVDVDRRAVEGQTAAALARGNGPQVDFGTAPQPGRRPAYVTRPEAIYGPGSGRSFFGDGWRVSQRSAGWEEAHGRLERHYAMLIDVDRAIQRAIGFDQGAIVSRAGDVLSSEIAGAYPNEYMPGLIVNRILKQRPLGGFYQRFPLEDGRPRIYPVVSTSTTVAAQGAEGSNPAASDFATTATTITPTFYGGETKVSRQVLDGADPSTDVMLSTDLNEAYMQASEAVIRAAVEAGSTASGVTLTAATPDGGLRALYINHLGTVFLPPEGLFLPTTLTNSWLTQNDTTGRPLAPAITPMNSDGLTSIDLPVVGQIITAPVVQSWSSTAGAGAGVGGVAVVGRRSDFAIFESNLTSFQYTEGAEAPSAVRIGLWAYLVVGTRRGSRKATGA